LYTSCVLGLHPSAFFNEFLFIKKKDPIRHTRRYPKTHQSPQPYIKWPFHFLRLEESETFWAKVGSKKSILQLKPVYKSSGQEFKLIFRSSLQPKGLGCGPSGREGARKATDEISLPEFLTEEGFGFDLVSNAFSSGSRGACVFSQVADSVMGLSEVGSKVFPKVH
jgi:hypothetical protein